jgi:hypothetical protein
MSDMGTPAASLLWERVAACVADGAGWRPALRGRLSRPRTDRYTWLAQGEPGQVVVKAVPKPFAAERAEWAAAKLPLLARSGYPVAEPVWNGPLDDEWFVVVQSRLPGEPLDNLGPAVLEQLLGFIELQAGSPAAEGGWDISWWVSVVLFEGWEGWWRTTWRVAPQEAGRLRVLLEPAWGYRLPTDDVVHHDLSVDNVLAVDGTISGVVDWDDGGKGSRAIDLAGLLFEWHHIVASGGEAATGGGAVIARRLFEVAGEDGLRCAVAYAGVDRIAHSAKTGTAATWRQLTGSVLATFSGMGITA